MGVDDVGVEGQHVEVGVDDEVGVGVDVGDLAEVQGPSCEKGKKGQVGKKIIIQKHEKFVNMEKILFSIDIINWYRNFIVFIPELSILLDKSNKTGCWLPGIFLGALSFPPNHP